MNTKIKISAFQMMFLLTMTILSTAILSIPAVTANHAGRDMWISPFFSAMSGIFTVFIINRLHKKYPNETIIQYSRHIVGGFLSKCIGFISLLYILLVTSIIVREYADFLMLSFLHLTPLFVVIGSMIIICAFSVRAGLETIARAAQVFFPIYILPLFLLLLLIFDFKWDNMFPILEHGFKAPLKGAIQPALWFNQIFMMGMLLPYITDKTKGRKIGYIIILFTLVCMVFINLVCLLVFGEGVSTYTYPVFTAFRYIYIPPFFERFESVVIVVWVLGVFIKISLFYNVLVIGTAQWLEIKNYKSLIFPYGFFIIVIAIWVSPNMAILMRFIEQTVPILETSIYVGIPVVLFLIAMLRGKKTKEGKDKQGNK
ncbi:GerAB/ArcD/ProY family transporter [Niallia sp. 03133]|uniref:GerAB/ArcD/ProY family transporter n=1 Tax=Niallia sp. 03133 TaxID=3458060 RepID=UPI004044EF20